nr:probable serine/threonine-protein kinase At1g54610 isoform X1 [Ipomoea batatas]
MLVIHQACRNSHQTERLMQNSATKLGGEALLLLKLIAIRFPNDKIFFRINGVSLANQSLDLNDRRKAGSGVRGSGSSRNIRRLRKGLAPTEEVEANIHASRRGNGSGSRGATVARMSTKSSYDTVSEAASQTATEVSQGDSICSVPAQMISSSSSYGWSKIKQDRAASRFHAYANSRSLTLNGTEPTAMQSKDPLGSNEPDAGGFSIRASNLQVEEPLSFHTPDIYHSKELSVEEQPPPFLSPDIYQSRELSVDSDGRAFSGPLTYRVHKRQDGQAAQSVRRSRFFRGKRKQCYVENNLCFHICGEATTRSQFNNSE